MGFFAASNSSGCSPDSGPDSLRGMELVHHAYYPHQRRVRDTLIRLSRYLDMDWIEEPIWLGCSSIESIFTITCHQADQREIGRRLLIRVPVYTLNQVKHMYGKVHSSGL